MFHACRQFSRLATNQNAVIKICSVNNDSLSPGRVKHCSGNSSDDSQDGRPNDYRSFCPFVLAKNLWRDYVSVIGAAYLVGINVQPVLTCLRHSKPSSNHRVRPVPPVPDTLSQKVLSARSRYQHFPIVPLFVLRASPTLHHVGLNSPAHHLQASTSPNQPEKDVADKQKLVSGRTLRQYRQELMTLSKNYTADLMNKIGVGLIESRNESDGVECLKANETSAKTLYNLAVAYETGRYSGQSSEPDLKLAFEYYDRAARLNHKFATYNLALFYLYGKGSIERDPITGSVLMKKAFDLGVDRAAAFKNFPLIDDARKVKPAVPQTDQVVDVRSWRFFNHLLTTTREDRSSGGGDIVSGNTTRMAICY